MSTICDICKHLNTKSNQVFQNGSWVVALAPDQGYLGRCYVTLREHKPDLASLTTQEWRDFSEIVVRLEHVFKKDFGASVCNWASMMNNAFQLDQPAPHVHWHFRPRYSKEVKIGKHIFRDPLFGHHYDRDQREHIDSELFQGLVVRIRSSIE